MTVLTEAEIKEQFSASKDEIDKYFKNHPKLKRTKQTVRKIRDRIRASKIVRSPGKEASFTHSAEEWQIIYGTQKVGGVITFVGVVGADNQNLNLVVTIAGHEINSIEKLYLDDEEVIFGASPDNRWSTYIRRKDGSLAVADHKVFMSQTLGAVGQSANADLIGQMPNLWTSNHKQDGCAHAYIILVWDAVLFPNGVPEITFLVQGKKCKLPNGSTAFTNNAAACIRDFLTDTRYGMAVPEAKIDADQYSDAYDSCHEDVGVLGGGTEKRYTVDGVFKGSESPQEILEAMSAAMGGTITYVNGLWKIYPAKWIAPSITLNEDDFLSDLRIQTRFSRRDTFNGVRGTFISPLNDYEEVDFPFVKNDFYTTLDNGERVWEDIQLPLTNSPARCQRLAKIELERNRQAITVQVTASLKAYQLQPMDTVYLNITRMGWVQKVFEVQEVTLNLGESSTSAPNITVELLLRETAEGIFDWANGQETSYDLAPNTTLPNPLYVPPMTNVNLASGTLQLYRRADGTIFSRIKISWDLPDDFFVTSGGVIQIQYKRTDAGVWTSITDTPGEINSAYILDVQDYTVQDPTTYDVRVRAKNALGVPGDWTTIEAYRVIGKTEPPGKVEGFRGQIESFGIRFFWDKSPVDIDVNEYEIRIGLLGGSWETSDPFVRTSGTSYAANVRLADDYQFFIKAVDTSGNYSVEAATLIAQIVGPEAPIVTIQLIQENYLLKWQEPDSLFGIDSYEISYGDPNTAYVDRVFVSNVRGLTFSAQVTWGGHRKFWITGIDVAGNRGTPAQISLNIEIPGSVNSLTTQILDQNVLLRWQAPDRHSLPIASYYIYKGAVLESAELIGDIRGTFAPLFEILGGTYTYWIRPVDTAGNQGDVTRVTAIVQPPTDFTLLESGDPETGEPYIDPSSGEGTHFSDENNRLIMPINVTETWDEHFVNNGLTNTQDAVNAGLSYLIQPVPTSAYWMRVLDYLEDDDVLIESALVTLDFVKENYDGVATVVTSIGYSADGVEWITTPGQQAFAQNFRYIRIIIQVGSFGEQSGEATGNIGQTYP